MKKVGQILLLISGIALLAIGVWALVTAVLGLLAIIAGSAAGKDAAGIAAIAVGIVILVVSVILLLCYVFAGIRGIKTFTKGDTKNINKAFVWAIIILVLNVISLVTGGLAPSGIAALVIDVAYIAGAFMVKLSK